MVKAIVGANWGDEGKGKITDMLAEHSDIVVRFQGGANAGHTIINDYGRFALHILPSGSFYSHVTNVIGNGVALDVKKLVDELKDIQAQNAPAPNLMISERVQLLMPYHALQDTYEEERLGGKSFGSTKSGIAPFYSDKYAKIGIQLCDLFDEDRLMERLTAACDLKNVLFAHLYHKPTLDPKALFDELMELRELVRPYVGDTVTFLHEALKEGKTVLLEGQLGSMKDPDLGIYPMTTSSHTLAGFGTVGACIPPTEIKDVIAVTLPSAASYEKQYAAGMEALEARKEAEAAAARAAEEAAAAEAEAAERAAEESFMASPVLVAEAAEAALEAEEAADIVVRARIAHDLEEVERGELDKTAEEIVAERIAEEAHLGEDIQKKYALPDADFALAFDQWTVVYADGSTRDFDSTSGILAD